MQEYKNMSFQPHKEMSIVLLGLKIRSLVSSDPAW